MNHRPTMYKATISTFFGLVAWFDEYADACAWVLAHPHHTHPEHAVRVNLDKINP